MDQAPLALCNLVGRGKSLTEARKQLGLDSNNRPIGSVAASPAPVAPAAPAAEPVAAPVAPASAPQGPPPVDNPPAPAPQGGKPSWMP